MNLCSISYSDLCAMRDGKKPVSLTLLKDIAADAISLHVKLREQAIKNSGSNASIVSQLRDGVGGDDIDATELVQRALEDADHNEVEVYLNSDDATKAH